MGLLPWPERLLGAGLVQGARSRGSRFLLGGAFAICAAPCIGPVLASILVLAGSSESALEGAASCSGSTRSGSACRSSWRARCSRARWARSAGSATTTVRSSSSGGAVLVALGLLLFFERFYVLRIYLNRFLEWLGPRARVLSHGATLTCHLRASES